MADQSRADAPDRFAHGAGHTEKKEAERDDFRPGVTGGASETPPDTGRASAQGAGRAAGTQGTAGAGPQSIEATTAALGDMEPSAGSEGRGAGASAESANDDDTRSGPRGDAASGPGETR